MDSLLLEECPESGDILHDYQYNSEFSSLSPFDIRFSNFNDEDRELLHILNSGVSSENPPLSSINLAVNSGVNPDGWMDETLAFDDFPDDCLNFISEILMEEDLDDQTGSLQDYIALQATEKSLLDALGGPCEHPSPYGQNIGRPDVSTTSPFSDSDGESRFGLFGKDCIGNNSITLVENGTRGRKNISRDDDIDSEEGRRNKHIAVYDEEYVQMEQFDDVFLCNEEHDCFSDTGDHVDTRGPKKKVRDKKKTKQVGQVADLKNLLTQCAQAVACSDLKSANGLLSNIRVHSSQYGDSTQRLAYYFGNALEARLAGTGWQKYKDDISRRIPSSEILKAYRTYVSAIPFRKASYFMANEAISKLVENSTRIHIIDFGILFGFQWPGLIHKLARRKDGPPVIRITGIDYPESGFRPAKRVEETGRRLAGYCERFKVPFKYHAIAKSWGDVSLDELHIDRDELVVVNCLFMSRKLLDETIDEKCPRDSFFKFIKKLKPDLFIHGIVNGVYNSPFFESRFREALFHYSSLFDMIESTTSPQSDERLFLEKFMYGVDALNVIACEGIERIERPETYIQWQRRIEREGFRKLVLADEVINKVTAGMKGNYHKDFFVYQNKDWLLQCWKGRILYAISCWNSA